MGNPDYILVCSKTFQHFQDIKLIEKISKNKIVLVEKPLFHKSIKLSLKKNKYYVGYNLRFHPVIKFLKNKLKKKKFFLYQFYAILFCQHGETILIILTPTRL